VAGLPIGAVPGIVSTCDYPAVSDVRLALAFGDGAIVGTLDLPAEADVQQNVQFDGLSKTGTFEPPAEENVVIGVTYGHDAEYTGAFSGTVYTALASADLAIRFDYAVTQPFTITATNDLKAAGSKLYLAIKEKESDLDSEAMVYVERTANLVYLNKVAAVDSTKGTLIVSGASGAWTVTFWLDESITGSLRTTKRNHYYEIKYVPAAGGPVRIAYGTAVLSYGIVRAVS
jgi:hypothetical protein